MKLIMRWRYRRIVRSADQLLAEMLEAAQAVRLPDSLLDRLQALQPDLRTTWPRSFQEARAISRKAVQLAIDIGEYDSVDFPEKDETLAYLRNRLDPII